MTLKRRGFFSAMVAGAITPLVGAKPTEERKVRFITSWEKQIGYAKNRDFLIKAAHVRAGVVAADEQLRADEMDHWRKHIFICKDLDELTEHVAQSCGLPWPPQPPVVVPEYNPHAFAFSYPETQAWPIRDGQYTFTTTSSNSVPITRLLNP